jgi:glycosyltransferase involved in cell wall biosynthesis
LEYDWESVSEFVSGSTGKSAIRNLRSGEILNSQFAIFHYAVFVKPRIVILSAFLTPFRSGAEACAEEVPTLLTDDFSFTIITARMSRSLPVHDHVGSIPVLRVGFGISFDKWLFPILAPLAAQQFKPVIVHAVLGSFAGLAMAFCQRSLPGTVRILTCQSTNTSLLLGFMHRSADHITAISSVLIERAKKMGRTDVVLIPNGIRLADIRSSMTETKKVDQRILFVGRLEPMKGVAVLLDAFASIAVAHPGAVLHIVGAGSLRTSLEARYPELVQSGRVVFLGYLPPASVYREFAEAEIFCALSTSEALGNVFLEAEAAGCAVIGTNVGGIPDSVKDGNTGLLVPLNDEAAAASAIERCLTEKTLRKELSEHAMVFVERYDWSAIADRYRAVYKAAIR